MRRHDHVPAPEQRVARGQRLRVCHVQRGARNPPGVERSDERGGVDERAAADVDEDRGGLEVREGAGVEDVVRGGGGGEGDEEDVGGGEEGGKR